MKDIENLEPGDLLMIDGGEYSDRYTIGPFRVLKPMNRSAVAEQYVADFKADPELPNDTPDPQGFVPWLAAKGYIEDVPSASWYVGSYGQFELS